MTVSTALGSIDAAIARYGHIGHIKFFGGEPLLNLDVIEAVCGHLDRRWCDQAIPERPGYGTVSNMTICDNRTIELVRKHNLKLTGSIDGPMDIHDHFRSYTGGRGSFADVDKNIKRYIECTNEPSALEVVYTPQHLAHGYTPTDIHRFLIDRYGQRNIILHPVSEKGDSRDLLSYSNRRRYESQIYELSLGYGRFIVTDAIASGQYAMVEHHLGKILRQVQTDSHCSLGVRTLTIAAGGKIHPCYTVIGDDRYDMGDTRSSDAFVTDRFRRVQLGLISNKKSSNAICSGCSILKTCKTCPGSMKLVNDKLDAPIPTVCDFLTGITEGVLLGLNEAARDRSAFDRFMEHICVA